MNKWMGVIRHVASMSGGVLVALGLASADQVGSLTTNIETGAGALLGIIAVVTSIVSKTKVSLDWFGGGKDDE